MLELTNLTVDGWNTTTKYKVTHSCRERATTLAEEITVISNIGSPFPAKMFNAGITITDCDADTYDGALTKLADWLERLALGIRERGESNIELVPFYTNNQTKEVDDTNLLDEVSVRD